MDFIRKISDMFACMNLSSLKVKNENNCGQVDRRSLQKTPEQPMPAEQKVKIGAYSRS
jgi:hypothetical protein